MQSQNLADVIHLADETQLRQLLAAYAGREDELAEALVEVLEPEWISRFLGLCERAEEAPLCVDVLHRSLEQAAYLERDKVDNVAFPEAAKRIASYTLPLFFGEKRDAAEGLEPSTGWYEITTAEQRRALPAALFNAITLPEYQRKHWPQLFDAHLEEFARAIGDPAFTSTNAHSAELPLEFTKLRNEQAHYMASNGVGYNAWPELSGVSSELWRKHGWRKRGWKSEESRFPPGTTAGCRKWIVYAALNGRPYGATFVFHDAREPQSKFLWMQGISLFALPAFYKTLEGSVRLPSLNALLLPAVEQLGAEIGASTLIVNPINKQREILRKAGFTSIACPAKDTREFQKSVCGFASEAGCVAKPIQGDIPDVIVDILKQHFVNASENIALAKNVEEQRVERQSGDVADLLPTYRLSYTFRAPAQDVVRRELAFAADQPADIEVEYPTGSRDALIRVAVSVNQNDAMVKVAQQLTESRDFERMGALFTHVPVTKRTLDELEARARKQSSTSAPKRVKYASF